MRFHILVQVVLCVGFSSCADRSPNEAEPVGKTGPAAAAGATGEPEAANATETSDTSSGEFRSITLSPETTVVSGPLTPRGRVDFIAALNEASSEGIAPEQNAVVVLARTLGTGLDAPADHAAFEKALGAGTLPQQAPVPISQSQFAERQGIAPAEPFFDACFDAGSAPWTAEEHPQVAAWLKHCQAPLDQCVEAVAREHYYYPLVWPAEEDLQFVSPLIGALLPLPQNCREVARGLQARAMLSLGQGDVEAARRDTVALLRLARHLSHGSTLIESLVAMATETMAVDAALSVLSVTQTDADQLSAFGAELRALPPFEPIVSAVNQGERFSALDLVQAVADQGLQVLEMANLSVSEGSRITADVDWDTALRTVNQGYDQLVEGFSRSTFSEATQAVNAVTVAVSQQAKSEAFASAQLLQGGSSGDRTQAGRLLGNLVTALTLPATGHILVPETRRQLRFDLLLVAVQLAEHRRQQGEFPESLDGFTQATDPYTGQPLLYRRTAETIVLYGRGPDEQDDGGPLTTDDPAHDDVGVVLHVAGP